MREPDGGSEPNAWDNNEEGDAASPIRGRKNILTGGVDETRFKFASRAESKK